MLIHSAPERLSRARFSVSDLPLRILFLTLRADFGGGPEHLWLLLQNMPPEIRVCVACPDDYPYYERYRERVGAENIVLLPHRRFCLFAFWRLRAFCLKQGVQLVHSHGKGAGLYARLLALLTGLPCVHSFHGVHMREYGRLKQCLYRLCEGFLSLGTRAAIAVSEGERAQILAEGFMPPAKLHLIPNGVGIPDATAGEAAGPPFRVIAMSSFNYPKHSGFVADIAEALRRRGRLEEFRFVTFGDGPERAGIMADAQARGLAGSLQYPGASLDPAASFKNALCCLSTSRWEAMPLAVLEALAHGLPAVASDVTGNRDAVAHNESGFLYPEGDADAAATALCRLAADPELRRSLGARARERALRRHDARTMTSRTLALLQSVARETFHSRTSQTTDMERILSKMCRAHVSPVDQALLDMVFAANPTQEMLNECLRVCDIEVLGGHKSLMFSYLMREHPELRFSDYARPRLKGLIDFYRFANIQVLQHFSRIGKALNAAGIPMLIFKGAAMKILRPDLSRPMGDVDILIPPDRMREAVSLCEKLGYRDAMADAEHATSIQTADGKDAVDIHRGIFKRDDTSAPVAATFHQGLFARAGKRDAFGVRVLLPAHEDLLFLVLTNLTKNLREKTSLHGLFYALSDCRFLLRDKPAFDWRIVRADIRDTCTDLQIRLAAEFAERLVPGILPDPRGHFPLSRQTIDFCNQIIFDEECLYKRQEICRAIRVVDLKNYPKHYGKMILKLLLLKQARKVPAFVRWYLRRQGLEVGGAY